jgi:hypothetical protein
VVRVLRFFLEASHHELAGRDQPKSHPDAVAGLDLAAQVPGPSLLMGFGLRGIEGRFGERRDLPRWNSGLVRRPAVCGTGSLEWNFSAPFEPGLPILHLDADHPHRGKSRQQPERTAEQSQQSPPAG